MAKFNFKCGDCKEKFTIEVTGDSKQERVCPQCGSENIKPDYEQQKVPETFEKDNIRCYCALK